MSKRDIEFYVVLRNGNDRYGPDYAKRYPRPAFGRATKNKPSLARGEVAVRMRLSVEEAVFSEFIPTIEAEVGDRMIAAPAEAPIEGEVLDPSVD